MTCLRTLPWHVAALLLATGAARADAPQPAARADAPPPIALGLSVLKVEARRAQGGFSLGSAVVVAPGELVTNCHVTRDATLLQVLYIGQRWTVKSQVVDIPHDLCLLRVPGLPAQAVALHDSLSLKPGHPVFAVGYTGGMALQASQGEVVALHRMDGGQVVQVNNWFSSGASGGALFDAQQRLVGVLTFRMPGGDAHYYAGPVEWVRALQLLSGAPVAPQDGHQLPYWQQPTDLQPGFLRPPRPPQDTAGVAAAGPLPDGLPAAARHLPETQQ
jgi:serine protease Do